MDPANMQNVQVKSLLLCFSGKDGVEANLRITPNLVAGPSGKLYGVITQGNSGSVSNSLESKGILGHTKVTEKGTEYICDFDKCQRSFSSVSYLRVHQNSHNKKELECTYPDCKRKFVWPHHLKYHLQAHKGEKPFKCDVENCNKSFISAQQMNVHKRTHTGLKPFICQECGKAFTTLQNRDSHHRTHTGAKPFKCDFAGCEKAFAESSSLKKHVLVHTGDKPHKCVHCNKRFTQVSTLRVHERRYHIENAMPTRSIANIQARQRAVAEAAAKSAAQAASQNDTQVEIVQNSGDLSAPMSVVYTDTSSSPFINDHSIISISSLDEPLEVVETLSTSHLLAGQEDLKEPPAHSVLPSETMDPPLYDETYCETGDQANLVINYSDEQCVSESFTEEGDRVVVELTENW